MNEVSAIVIMVLMTFFFFSVEKHIAGRIEISKKEIIEEIKKLNKP